MIEEEAKAVDSELSDALALAEQTWENWRQAGLRARLAASDKARYKVTLEEVAFSRRAYHSAENALLQLRKKRGI